MKFTPLGLLLAVQCAFIGAAFAQAPADPATRQIEYANGLYSREWFDDAVVEYRKFLKDFPNDPRVSDARYFLGESLYQQQKWQESLDVFNEAVKSATENPWRTSTLFRRGILLYQLDQKEGAIESLQQALARPDVSPEVKENAMLALGRAWTDTNKPDEALRIFTDSLSQFPQGTLRPFVQFEIARVALARQEYAKAIEAFQAAEKEAGVSPDFAAEAAYRVGEILYAQKEYARSQAAYEHARDAYPQSPWWNEAAYGAAWSAHAAGAFPAAASAVTTLLSRLSKEEFRPGAHYVRALTFYELKQYDRAAADFDTAAAINPGNLPEEQKSFIEQSPMRALWALFEGGRHDVLLERCAQWFTTDKSQGKDGDVRYLSAEAHYKREEYEPALFDYLDVLTNYPESRFRSNAYHRVGWCYYRLKRYDKAAQTLEKFYELYPDSPLAGVSLRAAAESRFANGENVEAASRYKEFIQKYPDDPDVEECLYRLGICFFNLKQFDNLAATYNDLLKRNPKSKYSGDASYWLGYNKQRRKEYKNALEDYNRVINEFPGSSFAGDARVQRAACLFLINDATGAAMAYHDIAVAHADISLSTDTFIWAGEQLYKSRKYEECAKTFEILMSRYPYRHTSELALYRIGSAMLETKKWKRAQEAFKQLRAAYGEGPYGAEAAYGLGRALIGLEKYQEAIDPLEQAANRSEGELFFKAKTLAGDAYAALGQHAAAKDAYMRVVAFGHPTYTPRALYCAGEALEKLGQKDRALQNYADLEKFYPESPYNGKGKERVQALSGAAAAN